MRETYELIFLRNSQCSKVDLLFVTPTSNARFSVSLYPHHLVLSVLLMLAILVGRMRDLSVILVCISLMTYDIGYLFMCLVAIFENYLFKRGNVLTFDSQSRK